MLLVESAVLGLGVRVSHNRHKTCCFRPWVSSQHPLFFFHLNALVCLSLWDVSHLLSYTMRRDLSTEHYRLIMCESVGKGVHPALIPPPSHPPIVSFYISSPLNLTYLLFHTSHELGSFFPFRSPGIRESLFFNQSSQWIGAMWGLEHLWLSYHFLWIMISETDV